MATQAKALSVIFISATGSALLLSILSYLHINSLIASTELVNHTTQVALELEKMMGGLKDAETGQRGYLFTKDVRFLDSFNNGLKKYPRHLANLQELVKEDLVQQKNLRDVKILAERRDAYLFKMVNLSKTRPPTASEMLIGKSIMDSLRIRVDKMIEIENDLMKKQTLTLRDQTVLAPSLWLAFALVTMSILILSFLRLNQVSSKREQAEQELKQQNVILENTNKELASFLFISSHDLQEPLRKIQMFTNLINEKEIEGLSGEGKNIFKRIENTSERMRQLINDLLSFSRINAKGQAFKDTDLNELLDQVKHDLNEKIISTNTIIESEGLPKLNVIPFQFKQLFTNLICNSIKYSIPGVPPHIKIGSTLVEGINFPQLIPKPYRQFHHITIADNGLGFDPEFQEQIFGLFQRLYTIDEFEGTGVGLAICKKIVENHSGIITARGQENNGATFNIYIPAEKKVLRPNNLSHVG